VLRYVDDLRSGSSRFRLKCQRIITGGGHIRQKSKLYGMNDTWAKFGAFRRI
jgi:hypothetical protein